MKSKFTMLLSACIVGAIIGAAIVWMLYNCCCHTSCGQKRCVLSQDSTGVKHINVTAANTLFKAYLALPHGVVRDVRKNISRVPSQVGWSKLSSSDFKRKWCPGWCVMDFC